MKCPSCGSEVDVANVFPGGSVTCACGAKVVVGAVAPKAKAEPAKLPSSKAAEAPVKASGACPRCSGPLNKRTVEETVADVCIIGDGLFVDHDHLSALRARGPSSVATSLDRGASVEETEMRYLPCPKCGERMMRQAAGGGVVVDVCGKHGTWFDAGELKAALAAKPPAEKTPSETKDPARATLDVALALEQARDEEDARRTIDVAEDVMDTFNWVVLGRGSSYRRRW